ncbi:MAG TPA: glycosyltransferase family 87 protein, partial [Rubrobacteraceae bacterium]|nr:glycosyltransferase family 87 protein [Rubrobacteraceae bacterium]
IRDVALFSVAFCALVLALWLDLRFASEILSRISTDAMYVHVDFHTFWHSAAALLEGRDAYGTEARLENLNPPFWVLLSSPLGLLEPLLAYRIFVLITLGITVGYLIWMAAEVGLRSPLAIVAVTMLLLSSPLLGTLALGQIYPFLALGLVTAWVADRRDRPLLSGTTLGLAVALKPSLLPVLLWPIVRRRWGAFGAALASGGAATAVGAAVVGLGATLDWLRLLSDQAASPYWDNTSLPGAATRLFAENEFAAHIAALPWTIPVAYALGIGAIAITAARARQGPEVGLWALVAASLLASPIAWHNYLVLLGPAILLLLAWGRTAPAFLLLALQSIPGQWSLLWSERDTVVASLALTLYLYILIAHWLILLSASKVPTGTPALEAGETKRG